MNNKVSEEEIAKIVRKEVAYLEKIAKLRLDLDFIKQVYGEALNWSAESVLSTEELQEKIREFLLKPMSKSHAKKLDKEITASIKKTDKILEKINNGRNKSVIPGINMRKQLQNQETGSLVYILFADPTRKDTMSEYVSGIMADIDANSGELFDIFCPGYIKELDGSLKFNPLEYRRFINSIEQESKWRYTGGASLLIVRNLNGRLNYDNAYNLDFTQMLHDGLIKNYNSFIESIMSGLKSDIELHLSGQWLKQQEKNAIEILSNINLNNILPSLVGAILKQTKKIRKTSKYFMPQPLSLDKKPYSKKIYPEL